MDNPLDKPRTPENFRQDVEDLARDLAYCNFRGVLGSRIHVNVGDKWDLHWLNLSSVELNQLQLRFTEKWLKPSDAPSCDHLAAYEFAIKSSDNVDPARWSQVGIRREEYTLTQKAFDLLEKPAQSPIVFVSYRRKESSEFALLVESRLRIAGADPDRIFIDKNIRGGALWEKHIHEQATSCDVFICLIGKTTFEPDSWVLRELEIVRTENLNAAIIPVCHHGVRMSDDIVQALLRDHNGTHVQEETALQYETAINFILNALGYATY